MKIQLNTVRVSGWVQHDSWSSINCVSRWDEGDPRGIAHLKARKIGSLAQR